MKTFQVKMDENAKQSVTMEYDLGDNLEKAVKVHGKAAVFACYTQGATIKVQGACRGAMRKSTETTDKGGKNRELTTKELKAFLASYSLESTTRKAADHMGNARKATVGMTAEQRAEQLTMLQAMVETDNLVAMAEQEIEEDAARDAANQEEDLQRYQDLQANDENTPWTKDEQAFVVQFEENRDSLLAEDTDNT